MHKWLTLLSLCLGNCTYPTTNGLKSCFVDNGHSSSTSDLIPTKLYHEKCHAGEGIVKVFAFCNHKNQVFSAGINFVLDEKNPCVRVRTHTWIFCILFEIFYSKIMWWL